MSSSKVDRFTSNQDQNDHRLILHTLSNTRDLALTWLYGFTTRRYYTMAIC